MIANFNIKSIRGYTAPEYALHGQLSEKVDIYSFGVVILEIICGQRISEVKNDPNGDYLLERVISHIEYGHIYYMIIAILKLFFPLFDGAIDRHGNCMKMTSIKSWWTKP